MEIAFGDVIILQNNTPTLTNLEHFWCEFGSAAFDFFDSIEELFRLAGNHLVWAWAQISEREQENNCGDETKTDSKLCLPLVYCGENVGRVLPCHTGCLSTLTIWVSEAFAILEASIIFVAKSLCAEPIFKSPNGRKSDIVMAWP